MERGEYAVACPRLAESQRLEPAGGTLLALALCYEGWGRKATAWALFQEAGAMAHAQGRKDREAIASSKTAELEREIAFVTVELGGVAHSGVEVTLDGLHLAGAAVGTPTAVDAGPHRIEASHDGSTYFSETITIGPGRSVVVPVPAPPGKLIPPPTATSTAVPEPAPRVAPNTPSPQRAPRVEPSPERTHDLERAISRVALGMGLTALLAGSYFGVRAIAENRKIERGCTSDPCNPALEPVQEAAQRDAALADWLFVSGAIVTGAGIVGMLTFRRSTNTKPPQVGFGVAPGAAALRLTGDF